MINLDRAVVGGSYVGLQQGLQLEFLADVGEANSLEVLSCANSRVA